MPEDARQRLLEELAEHHACYVLITCDQPNELGKLDVELSYDGDPALAAYLLEGAQSFIDDHFASEEDLIEHEQ